MNLSTNKIIIKYYYSSIIMITNGLLFTFLFAGTPLSIWRQILWLIGIGIFLYHSKKFIHDSPLLSIYIRIFIYSVFLLILMSLYSLVVLEFNPIRLFFGWFIYLFGYSGLLFPYYIQKYSSPLKFYKFMSVLGIFISIGLIIDSFFSIFSIFRISPDVALFVESKGEANRATFFSESPTVLAIFYTFSLLCTIYCFFLTKKLRTKIMYVFSFLVYILGAFATNSRQILIIIFIIIIVSFIYLSLIQNKNQIIYLFIFMIASIICAFYANKYISNKQEESQARFTIESIREDERKLLWKKGMEQMKFYNFWSYPLGHGFVYTIEQKSKPHEQSHHHFESTVWASFYDGGLLSWFIIFFPCLYALHQLWIQKKSFLKLLLFLFFIDYGIICFVAPGGLHPTATLCSFITIGIILNFKKFNLE